MEHITYVSVFSSDGSDWGLVTCEVCGPFGEHRDLERHRTLLEEEAARHWLGQEFWPY